MSRKWTFEDFLEEVYEWNREAGHVTEPADQLDRWESDVAHRQKALDLIEEEVSELAQAVEDNDKVETLDALGDILFTVFGLAAKSGHIDVLEEGFKEICESNWSKLDGNKTDPNVKVGKSAKGYKPPRLDIIVEKAEKRGLL